MKHANFVCSIFLIIFFAKFLFTFTFHKFFNLKPPENQSYAQKLIKIIHFPNTFSLFLLPYQVSGFYVTVLELQQFQQHSRNGQRGLCYDYCGLDSAGRSIHCSQSQFGRGTYWD